MTPRDRGRSSPGADLVGVWGRDREKTTALARALDTRPYTDAHALLADVTRWWARCARRRPRSRSGGPRGPAPAAGQAARAVAGRVPTRWSRPWRRPGCGRWSSSPAATSPMSRSRCRPRSRRAVGTVASVTVFVSVLNPGGVLLDSTWRVEKGALWDAGPHAISPLVPVLGPIVEVSALEGPRRTSYLLLRHEGGAVSTVATTLDAPKAAGTWSIDLHGPPGWWSLPGWNLPACDAFEHAIADLHRAVTRGTDTLCDVRTARDGRGGAVGSGRRHSRTPHRPRRTLRSRTGLIAGLPFVTPEREQHRGGGGRWTIGVGRRWRR